MERLISDFDEGFIKMYTYVDILDTFIIILNFLFLSVEQVIDCFIFDEFQKRRVNDLNNTENLIDEDRNRWIYFYVHFVIKNAYMYIR